MLTLENNISSASDPYVDALKWFKDKSGIDFFELCDDESKRKDFYAKENSVKNEDDDCIHDIYKNTVIKHYMDK